MNKYILILLFFTFSLNINAQKGSLKGQVKNYEVEPSIQFANITIIIKDSIVFGNYQTDINGYFHIKSIPAGKISVKCSSNGYVTVQYNNFQISDRMISFLDFSLISLKLKSSDFFNINYIVPRI